ncbi:AzlD domain-containing protein [Pseudooceanicola sp.]|uniref:AzlD domain-containing protein n=1 Tax=Pseudooceanicola sp. TaxID=1914328 RepID=UPI0026285330|nr:AzlD domain-containing protein [Pseudooceanicola sp.]MDF1855330.1 AzlD domain-containing protein [Pseudooceanicola sp.]
MIARFDLWLVIILLALGSFGLRFAFLGIIGNRKMPDWLLRHLRYTAVAVLPALVAPLVAWPAVTGGTPDPARLIATFATLAIGMLTRNVFAGIATGVAVLFTAMALLG